MCNFLLPNILLQNKFESIVRENLLHCAPMMIALQFSEWERMDEIRLYNIPIIIKVWKNLWQSEMYIYY